MAQKTYNKSYDKKKVLPTKKFPELKQMINGDFRNGSHSLSSDEDMNIAVSCFVSVKRLVSSDQEDLAIQRGTTAKQLAKTS